jgi:hypothetical protein
MGGIRTDAMILEHPRESVDPGVFSYLLVFDFPFSLPLDVLLLPYTIPRGILVPEQIARLSHMLPDGRVIVKVAPPPPQQEELPWIDFEPDQIWIPGHWDWVQTDYTWHPGHVGRRPRPDAVWIEDRWEPYLEGWVRYRGHWKE